MRVVVIDADCVICNGFARFVIKRDSRRVFRFASQYSQFWADRAERLPFDAATTILLFEEDRVYGRSSGVLRILRECGPVWALVARFASWIPKPVRDAVYDFVARHRRGFNRAGPGGSCPLPPPELRDRFLD